MPAAWVIMGGSILCVSLACAYANMKGNPLLSRLGAIINSGLTYNYGRRDHKQPFKPNS